MRELRGQEAKGPPWVLTRLLVERCDPPGLTHSRRLRLSSLRVGTHVCAQQTTVLTVRPEQQWADPAPSNTRGAATGFWELFHMAAS